MISILFSWITVAKVPITVYAVRRLQPSSILGKAENMTSLEQSSEKASVIRVPGGLTSGLHTRISLGGLREWHIFGSIRYIAHTLREVLTHNNRMMISNSFGVLNFQVREKTRIAITL
jgi:hypothetical protein